jgi:hypothetical protein
MRSPDTLKQSLAALLFCALATTCATNNNSLASGKQQKQRKIVSEDFTRNRPPRSDQSAKPSPGVSSAQKRPKSQTSQGYYLASQKQQTSRPAHTPRRPVVAQLGLTIWRLRPMTAADKGATVLVKENETQSEWVAERVEADTVFRKGDFVRLSVESPRNGFLYVVNRDQFADGTTGDPFVIYPWGGMALGENRVRPGRIIDIPGQEDNPIYFKAEPIKENQVGELLTIFVTKTPLNLPISQEPLRVSKEQFVEWQRTWKADSERFEMEGGAGRLWTEQERQAGSRTRPRQLTRTDPAPQTIYHVTASNTAGYLVNVRLAYAK